MPITFPRALPDLRWLSAHLRLERYQNVTKLVGGSIQVQEVADPRWALDLVTAPLSPTEMQALAAWFDSLRGGLRSFLGRHTILKRPASYYRALPALRAGGGAFDGTATVFAVTDYSMTLTTLPASFIFTAGDRVGLSQNSRYGLYRVVEDVTANGSGTVTLTVEPRINPSLFTTSAVANVAEPVVEMILKPDSIPDLSTTARRQSASFSAIQKLY